MKTFTLAWMALVLFTSSFPAFAQIATTGQISGRVLDQSAAAVPDVDLRLQSESTGSIQTVTSAPDGGFSFPTLLPGSYSLTATLSGFETVVYRNIVVNAARTTDQTVTLRVGAVTETVEVAAEAPVLQTSSTTVAGTVDQKYIQDLPLGGRDTLQFALLMPGAQQGVSSRDSTFNGLPGASVNITLNGIANNAQRFKSGGTSFFAFVPPRLESIQEVTVATSNLGANSTGQGGMQIQYVTKSGTNAFHGELFWQHRNSALGGNSWFNNARGLPRPNFIRNDQGGAIGGPAIKNKVFFFFSYALVKTPQSNTYSAQVLTPAAQAGTFSYVGSDGTQRSANLLDIAAQNGFQGTVNPIIGSQLQKIQGATSDGSLSQFDLFRNRVTWLSPQPSTQHFTTVRVDYQVTDNLRINFNETYFSSAITKLRGSVLPGEFLSQAHDQTSKPWIASGGATWVISPHMVNEFSFGGQSNFETFNIGFDIETYKPRLLDFPLGLPSGLEERNGLGFGNTFQPRNNPVYNLVDNVHLQSGRHSFNFGGNFIRTTLHQASLGDAGIPRHSFGIVSSDPVNQIFSTTTLPGITNDARNDALNLYALLTGTISRVTNLRNVDEDSLEYGDFNPVVLRERQTSFGLYFQDSWRASQSLTFNYGLRWDFHGANINTNDIYTSPTPADLFGPSGLAQGSTNQPNLFAPGSLLGSNDPAILQRSQPYNRDFSNPAPHVGLAWNPTLFGSRNTVFRAGYSVSYYSEGLLNLTNNAGNNPGLRQTGNLTPDVDYPAGSLKLGDTLPPFQAFPSSFTFPLSLSNFAFTNTTVGSIDPEINSPYVQSWTASVQQQLREGTVFEARYVGNKGTGLWHTFNVNEVNIYENGFLQQFVAAQKNLDINGQASFANNGLAGQASTPIFDAAFAGLSAGQGYANNGFINLLRTGQAGQLANNLATNSTYFCRMVGQAYSPCAGTDVPATGPYPANFFQLNPSVGTARYLTDNSFSNYHGMQLELRQRFSSGLQLNANYTWSHSINDRYNKNVDNLGNFFTLRDRGQNVSPSTFDIRHIFQLYGTYQLPIGRGRALSINNAVLDGIFGGWTIGSIFRMQSGLPFQLSSGRRTVNQEDAGVVLANGATAATLQDGVGVFKQGPDVFFLNPNLVGSDGRADPSVIAPPTAPGVLGGYVYLHGPKYVNTDFSLAKEITIHETWRMEIRAQFLNAFNHPIFEVPTGGTFGVNPVNITGTTFGRTTTTTTDPRNIEFRIRLAF